MFGTRAASAIALVIAVASSVPRASLAGLSYVSQERLVFAGAGDSPEKRSTGPGRFSADVSGESVNESGDHMGARATQSSVLGDTFIRASGRVAGDSGADLVSYRALLRATFDVAATTPYHLSSSIDFGVFHPNGNLDLTAFDPLYSVSLLSIPTDGDTKPLVDVRRSQYEFLNVPPGPSFSVDRSGTLSPGRYELRLNIQSQFAPDAEDGTYQLNFTTRGAGPRTVPLPPAVWTGLLSLVGTAVVCSTRRPCRWAFRRQ